MVREGLPMNPSENPVNPEVPTVVQKPSLYEQVSASLLDLQIKGLMDPNFRTDEWQQQIDQAIARRQELLKQAKDQGIFQDLDFILKGLYKNLTEFGVTKEISLQTILQQQGRDVDSHFWQSPSRKPLESFLRGTRADYYQGGLEEIRNEILGQPLSVPQEGEWSLIEVKKELEAEKKHLWREINTNAGNIYELLIRNKEDLRPAAKDLINFLETRIKNEDSEHAEPLLIEGITVVARAVMNAAGKLGLDGTDDEVKSLLSLTSTRFLLIGSSKAAAEGGMARYLNLVGGITGSFTERMEALYGDVGGLTRLATIYMEEGNGEVFRNSSKKNQILERLAVMKLKDVFKDELKMRTLAKIAHREGGVEELFEEDPQKIEQLRILREKIVGIRNDATKSEDQKKAEIDLIYREDPFFKDAQEAYDVAERPMVTFGLTTRYGGARLKEKVDVFDVGTPFEVLVRAELGDKVAQYVPNFASDPVIDKILDNNISTPQLEVLRKVVNPTGIGSVTREEVKMKLMTYLEGERRKYYEAADQVRQKYQGKIEYGSSGGALALKRLFYLPEYVKTNPGVAKAQGLADTAELYVRDFVLEEGYWTMEEYLQDLFNQDSLLGMFDLGFWTVLGRLKGADGQRVRFIGGSDGNQSYIGFLKEPFVPWRIEVAEKGMNKNKGLLDVFVGNPVLIEPFIDTIKDSFKNFIPVAAGFGYLADRNAGAQAFEYAVTQLYHKTLAWLKSKEPEQKFGYPDQIHEDNFKKTLKTLLEREHILLAI